MEKKATRSLILYFFNILIFKIEIAISIRNTVSDIYSQRERELAEAFGNKNDLAIENHVFVVVSSTFPKKKQNHLQKKSPLATMERNEGRPN